MYKLNGSHNTTAPTLSPSVKTTAATEISKLFLGLPVAALVVIGVSGFVVLILLIAGLICCVRMCRRRVRSTGAANAENASNANVKSTAEAIAELLTENDDGDKTDGKRKKLAWNPGKNYGLGTLRYAILYSPKKAYLRVKIIAGAGIRSERGHMSGCFIRVSFKPRLLFTYMKTKIKKKSSTPMWKESFVIHNVTNDILKRTRLYMELLFISKNDPPLQFGEIHVPLSYFYTRPQRSLCDQTKSYELLSASQISIRPEQHGDDEADIASLSSNMQTVVSTKTGFTQNQMERYLQSSELGNKSKKIRSFSIPDIVSKDQMGSNVSCQRRRTYSTPGFIDGNNDEFLRDFSDLRRLEGPKSDSPSELEAFSFFQMHSKTGVYGEILIALMYDKSRSVLQVTVVKARGIVGLRDDVSIYVRTTVMSVVEGCVKQHGKYKSSKRQKSESPVWNETYVTLLPIKNTLKHCFVVIQFVAQSKNGGKKLLSSIRVGSHSLSEQKRHWQEMQRKMGSPIPMWHACYSFSRDKA